MNFRAPFKMVKEQANGGRLALIWFFMFAMFLPVFIAPGPAMASGMSKGIVDLFCVLLAPISTIVAALALKWPLSERLLDPAPSRFARSLLILTIAELFLWIVSGKIADHLAKSAFIINLLNSFSSEIGAWYVHRGVTAFNNSLLFFVNYLLTTAAQFILTILPNAVLLRNRDSRFLVFHSLGGVLVVLGFALAAPFVAGALTASFMLGEIRQQKALHDSFQARIIVKPSPQSGSKIMIQPIPAPGMQRDAPRQ
jgi:hypothetical protein